MKFLVPPERIQCDTEHQVEEIDVTTYAAVAGNSVSKSKSQNAGIAMSFQLHTSQS